MSKGRQDNDVKSLLERLAAGESTVDEVLGRLRLLQIDQLEAFARLDPHRDRRKGVPEVVYAPGKTEQALEAIVRRLLAERGFSLVTRLEIERADRLRQNLTAGAEPVEGLDYDYRSDAGLLVARTPTYEAPPRKGCVGILTAGTSDIPVAEEAAMVAEHMGCQVERGYDVGVAGLHRLAEPLGRILRSGAAAIVVVAGMEGALPSVVGGLVDVPVIGVPTSTGYGIGGDGTAALHSILQSCCPGVVAVNIDNGVGAGAVAALIARGKAL